MNPPVPPEPDPPEPEPDPPEPGTTYSFTAVLTYDSSSDAAQTITLSLSYKATAESEWVEIDSESLISKSSGGATVVLENIPAGCHSVKLSITPTGADDALIKNAGSGWESALTYGSGNQGWNQDYESNISVLVRDN